jgi:xanthine/CO dehydrogenase XdhC/CoxF family maturation factor
VLTIELAGDEAAGLEPIGGGSAHVLVDPTAAKDAEAYRAAAQAQEQRQRGVLVTRVRKGPPVVTEVSWHPDAAPSPETQAPGEWVLVEQIAPVPRLLIAGGGHIGQALAAQAALVGFEVTVIDDRPEFADPALFPPGARTVCADIAATLAAMETDEETYFAIVTRGHRYDAEALQACLPKPAAYLGMIGSRRKVALVRESLLESRAATEEQLDAVHAPIGLDIGAETVPEIATSILAEMIAVRRLGPQP